MVRVDLLLRNVAAARTAFTTGDLVAAEPLTRRSIELDPAHLPMYAQMARIYLRQGKVEQARQQWEELVKRNPNHVGALTMVGMLYETQQNLDGAEDVLRSALGQSGGGRRCEHLAMIYADAGQNLEYAERLAVTAVDARPNQPEILDTLGWVHYRSKRPDLAISAFRQCIEQDPGNPADHYQLGLALAQRGLTDEARRAAAAALKLNPDYADARKLLDDLTG